MKKTGGQTLKKEKKQGQPKRHTSNIGFKNLKRSWPSAPTNT